MNESGPTVIEVWTTSGPNSVCSCLGQLVEGGGDCHVWSDTGSIRSE